MPSGLDQGPATLVLRTGGVERPRAPGVNGLDSVEHVLDRDVKARRDLGRGRMAPELLGETVGRTVDPHRQLPQASRQPRFQT